MGRIVGRVVSILAAGGLAVAAGVSGNVLGAVFFGLVALSLVWFAVRPAREAEATTRPLRGMALGAAGATAVSVIIILMAIDEAEDAGGRGLLVLAGLSAVALALLLWGLVLVMWRRGWRWASTTTWGELEAAKASGQRLEAPAARTDR